MRKDMVQMVAVVLAVAATMVGCETRGKDSYQLAVEWVGVGGPGVVDIVTGSGLKITVRGRPANLRVLVYDAEGNNLQII